MEAVPIYMPKCAIRGINKMVRGERYVQINLKYGVSDRFVYNGYMGELPDCPPLRGEKWFYMRCSKDEMMRRFGHHSYGDYGIMPYSSGWWNNSNFTIKESSMRKAEIKKLLYRISNTPRQKEITFFDYVTS